MIQKNTLTTSSVPRRQQVDLFGDLFGKPFWKEESLSTNFPPYSIFQYEKCDRNRSEPSDIGYELLVAVAGYPKDALSVDVTNNIVTICGDIEKSENKLGAKATKTIKSGIAQRNFVLRFSMGDRVQVDEEAEMADGLLRLKFIEVQPQSPPKKQITIK